jgi:hypothetical protein
VIVPISYDVLDDHNSYFKFNLNTITLYNLIRLEDSSYYRSVYMNAYNVMRRTTDDHGNAHFNMIDRGLKGPDSSRDDETRNLLENWLQRSRRDEWVDWRGDARYLPAARIGHAAPFRSLIECVLTFCGSAVHSSCMAEDKGTLREPASTTSFPIGWRGITAYCDRPWF